MTSVRLRSVESEAVSVAAEVHAGASAPPSHPNVLRKDVSNDLAEAAVACALN
jgi:hypothetical protein